MLIKAVAAFKIENAGGKPLELAKDELADLRVSVAKQCILQGAAVPANLADEVKEKPAEKPAKKSNHAASAKE